MSILEREGEIEFFVSQTYTLDDLHKVQAKSIEMYRKIAAVLDRHNIAYTLGYGSLLGQIRHSGYIPWDDDIDLFIMSSDYGRAILHLRRELPGDLLLHNRRNDPVYWVTWVKVRDLSTFTLESMWKIDRKFKYHGVCIDLIRVVPTTAGKYRHGPRVKELAASLEKSRDAHFALRGQQRLADFPRFAAAEVKHRIQLGYHKLKRSQGKEKLLIAAPGTIIERSFRYDDMYPIRTDGPLFEGMQVNTPNNPEGVLRSMYGDFMSLPPLEDRQPHFESVEFFEEGDSPEGALEPTAQDPDPSVALEEAGPDLAGADTGDEGLDVDGIGERADGDDV